MKRFFFAVVMSLLFFLLLTFIYSNLNASAFGYNVIFYFHIPHILTLRSAPIPLGFVLLIAFCGGMIAIALLEALPSLYKTLELRSKNKKIRQLERELAVARQVSYGEQPKPTED